MRLSSNMGNQAIADFLIKYLEDNTAMSEHNRLTIEGFLGKMVDDAAKTQMHLCHIIDLKSEIKELKEEIINLGYDMIDQANLNDN